MRKSTLLAFLLPLSSSFLHAQETTTAALPSQPSDPERIVIEGMPIEESILPTIRPYNAAFGTDRNILDVPRSVTIISREQLDAIGIQDVRDFTKLTSSSYTTSNFGAPANPSLRGQTADVFINGMRRSLTSNGNGLPINFNSVESVDIFKGPPTVIYGASNYTGGFINLVTKRPYLSAFQGEASFTYGEYDQRRWTLDFGGPLASDLAYRLSYSGEESGSFYENGNKDTEAIYGALIWVPTSSYTLEMNGEFFEADYTENFGINRVTQDLINHGNYITGSVADQNGDGRMNGQDVFSGFNTVIPDGTIKIDRSRRLLRPGDGSYGKSVNGQIIQTFKVDDDFTIVNNTFYNYIKRDTRSSYYYSEIVDDAQSIENRTEFRLDFGIPFGHSTPAAAPMMSKDAPSDQQVKAVLPTEKEPYTIKAQVNFGLDIRYQAVQAFNDFSNEPANAWDLSQSRSYIDYVNYGGDVPVPGYPGRFAAPGISAVNGGDTNDSQLLFLSPFLQTDFKFTDQLSLLLGGRLDVVWVKTIDPLFDPHYVDSFATLSAGQLGYDGRDSTLVGIPNFNISPSFKPFPWMTTYFTYNYSQSLAVGNGGGFPSVQNSINVQGQLRRESELFEFGAKASLFDDKLFLSSAAFKQTRAIAGVGGRVNNLDVLGVEAEVNYQPSRHFYATVGYTFLDAFYKDQSPFSVQTYPFNEAPNYFNLTDTFGSFKGYPVADYEQPGLPDHLFNALVSYNFDTNAGNFGAILGAVVTGPYNLDYRGDVTVPWQYNLDLTLVWSFKNVTAKLAILNLTDEENWSPAEPTYALDSVTADLPRRIEGTISFKF